MIVKGAIVVGVVVAILFSAAYYLALSKNNSESADVDILYVTGDTQNPDRVDIVIYILSMDPHNDDAKFRLFLYPKGNLSKDGLSSIYDLKLIAPEAVRSGSGGWIFEKEMPLGSVDISYTLRGEINEYPFDKHSSQLILALNRTDPDLRVPSTAWITGGIHGYHFELEPVKDFPKDMHAMKITVNRSTAVQETAIACMVIMWAIGIGVFALIVLMLTGWYNVRMPALFATLLFGLYGLRNSLPGAPPIGTHSDFLSFLWVQGIVALALLVSLIATLKQRPT